MPETQELSTAEDLVERVAAIDVAKASGMVCVRLPHETRTGRRVQEVWNVPATTTAILELGHRLVCQGVARVVMEATGAYWKPYFFLLEARGLECWLVNARDVKNVPGRPKTDKLDAVWLAKLTERGMLRPSFVPPKPVRQLRDLARLRAVLNQERCRHKQRVEKILAGYGELVLRHPEAYADHAADFWLTVGADVERSLQLALQNLAFRQTARAHALFQRAVLAQNRVAEAGP
ncbi:IS110 family transposase [Streptomyces mirabilis]|uniref:IS110 family transposase n=1 Tax=Streptomyces mirabilis TaxID=68239 RepID=UPI003F4D15F2